MSPWSQLRAAWLKAKISDAEFIRCAEEIGFGYSARELIRKDLETP